MAQADTKPPEMASQLPENRIQPCSVSVLGKDPNTVHRLNANAYQQNAITSYGGVQYAALWTDASPSTSPDGTPVRHITLARRFFNTTPSVSTPTPPPPSSAAWHHLTLTDYAQTADDGHNTISLGVCPAGGTIHLAFDMHSSPLRYRHSVPSVARHAPAQCPPWTPALFPGPVLDTLPGLLPGCQFPTADLTYPRFVRNTPGRLLFEARTGRAGAGAAVLATWANRKDLGPGFGYRVPEDEWPSFSPNNAATAAAAAATAATSGPGPHTGQYLSGGAAGSPYIHGISSSSRGFTGADWCLHVSWTYRAFVDYPGADDEDDAQHRVQAGPNGPENNYDLHYARGAMYGRLWQDSAGKTVAVLRGGEAPQGITTLKDGEHVVEGGEGKTKEENENTSKAVVVEETPQSKKPRAPHDIQPPPLAPPPSSATTTPSTSSTTTTTSVRVRTIPQNSGIMNQESQCIGHRHTRDFHVLSRDNTSGSMRWRHDIRHDRTGAWTSEVVQISQEQGGKGKGEKQEQGLEDNDLLLPTATGLRGAIASNHDGRAIYFLLPGNMPGDTSLTLLRRRKFDSPNKNDNNDNDDDNDDKNDKVRSGTEGTQSSGTEEHYGPFEWLWHGAGFDGEPNVDRERLEDNRSDGVLSVFTRTAGVAGEREVVVLDFDVKGLE